LVGVPGRDQGEASLQTFRHIEVAVVGGGPAGVTAAIALAGAGIETALIGKRQSRPDNRTTALLFGSINALEVLGVWQTCRRFSAPLRAIQIIDDTRRLLRAPQVRFAASELGLEAFGANIENRHLIAALDARAAGLPHFVRIDEFAEAIMPAATHVEVAYSGGGRLRARLVIGADGHRSICRTGARIGMYGFDYDQSALTLNFGHARPHNEVSTEFHAESGPFTLVPLPGTRSSLVWVVSPDVAEHLARLHSSALAETIEQRSHAILGRTSVEGECSMFRLGVKTARRFAAHRIALVGEAAHILPPIGAQGLNLGLRDGATIAELVVAERRQGRDVGATELLNRYDAARRPDVTTRTLAIDLLNRSLLSEFLPVHGIRGAGLYLLDRIGPLRRALMREGIAPALSQPRLMRGEAL
jgi:2-octaprenyl-6-methoxyphenol hydroxylase